MSQQNSKSASIASNCGGCLVILIVMGVFVSIVTPSFLAVEQLEAINYVSSMNKSQPAYFAKNNVFSPSFKALKFGYKSETTKYKYFVQTTKKATFNYGVSKHKRLKSFVGGVFVIPTTKVESNSSKIQIPTTSIFFRADSAGTIKPPQPTYQKGKIACATGTIQLTQ
jgi:type IV pilus assembly protein PilA